LIVVASAAVFVGLGSAAAGAAAYRDYVIRSGDSADVLDLDLQCRYAGGGTPRALICWRRSTGEGPYVAITAREIRVIPKGRTIFQPKYRMLRTP